MGSLDTKDNVNGTEMQPTTPRGSVDMDHVNVSDGREGGWLGKRGKRPYTREKINEKKRAPTEGEMRLLLCRNEKGKTCRKKNTRNPAKLIDTTTTKFAKGSEGRTRRGKKKIPGTWGEKTGDNVVFKKLRNIKKKEAVRSVGPRKTGRSENKGEGVLKGKDQKMRTESAGRPQLVTSPKQSQIPGLRSNGKEQDSGKGRLDRRPAKS